MENYANSVKNAFKERESTIILGLTGRTGSGCTTVAKILSKSSFKDIDMRDAKTYAFQSKDERKYEIVYNYMKEPGRWKPFTVIEGSSLILSFIIGAGFEEFKKHIESFSNNDSSNPYRVSAYNELMSTVSGMQNMFNNKNYCFFELDEILTDKEKIDTYYHFYIEELPRLKQKFHDSLSEYTCQKEVVDEKSNTKYVKSNFYTYLMQEIGNNIRSSGNPYESNYTECNYYDVAVKIDYIIKIIKKYDESHDNYSSRICIDAIRNSYEAYYFKDKYSMFYLVSIDTDDSARKERLSNLNSEEINSLDRVEYDQSSNDDYALFYHQNLQDCLSVSDIHLYNPQVSDGKYYYLSEQIVKYISLMLHPGLVTPTHTEHCMQTAYTARVNSGCLSRQVGAVITDADFSIKAIGWNEVPEGHVPCNLRCIPDYCANKDQESFSSYELNDPDFQEALEIINGKLTSDITKGMHYSFCFKDIYNSLTDSKNQVHTRSLHAEENAFLQLSKYGGQGIKGGKLFTTASPCELCAKKAFQLGIKEIYYIDPYPGISMKHILSFGTKFSPQVKLFFGAVGDAYIKLYTPRIAQKDELKLLTGLNPKKIISNAKNAEEYKLKVNDIRYEETRCLFIFNTRTDVKEIVSYKILAQKPGIKRLPQYTSWSGNVFNGYKINNHSVGCSIDTGSIVDAPCYAMINFDEELSTEEPVSIEIESTAKDEKRMMSPYYVQFIGNKTDKLTIEIHSPHDLNLLSEVKIVVYADKNMSKDYIVSEELITSIEENDTDIFKYSVDAPNLLYVYSIEWKFNN